MPFEVPECHYCDPEMVAETLDLPDPTNPDDVYKFSNISHPNYNQVCRMIVSNEDKIDRRLKRSWRMHKVVDQVLDIPRYQHDENSWRSDYFLYNGYTIPLQRDILPWHPDPIYEEGYEGDPDHIVYPGDKLEVRSYSGKWQDVSNLYSDVGMNSNSFSFDYKGGRLFLRTFWRQPRYNAVRISYRFGGTEEDLPDAIQRLCCLMTAIQILNSQFWVIKVGAGGDIGAVRNSMIRLWQDEINEIISAYQRPGKVYSMITR